MRFFRRSLDRPPSRGQALVEFAIVLPLLAVLLVMAIDFGRVFFTYIALENAAREAAAYGAVQPDQTSDIQDRAAAEANVQGQGGEGAMSVSTVCRDSAGTVIACAAAPGGAGAGNTLTVSVERPFGFVTPLVDQFFGNAFTLRTDATSTVLGYAGQTGSSPPGGCSGPTADFTIIITGTLSVQVDPAASSPNAAGNPCNISGYIWTWGDGNDEIGQATAADHTYTSPGTYTVRLDVTNQAGQSTKSIPVTVPQVVTPTCAKPHAGFTVTTSGPGGKTHTYHDVSTVADAVNCPITNWLWTFPDGTVSNAPNPAPQTYQTGARHTVTLKVTNAGGDDTFSFNH